MVLGGFDYGMCGFWIRIRIMFCFVFDLVCTYV